MNLAEWSDGELSNNYWSKTNFKNVVKFPCIIHTAQINLVWLAVLQSCGIRS